MANLSSRENNKLQTGEIRAGVLTADDRDFTDKERVGLITFPDLRNPRYLRLDFVELGGRWNLSQSFGGDVATELRSFEVYFFHGGIRGVPRLAQITGP